MMKKSDEFLACQKKIKNVALKRLSLKDKKGTTRNQRKHFPDDSEERDYERKPPRYWRKKDEHLGEISNPKRAKQGKSL